MPDAGALPRQSAPRASLFYGWINVGVAALAMIGTLPGRTQGLGLITEPLLVDLGLSRVAFAEMNLVATLVGSLFCLGVGRLVDRAGSRLVLTAVSLALGGVVLAMSRVHGAAVLLLLVTLSRGFGQSALSVASLALVGKWFSRRLSVAMGVYSVVMSVGFMIAFPSVGAAVLAEGWRVAWGGVAGVLLLAVAPLCWVLTRDTPEACGLEVDGTARPAPGPRTDSEGATLGAALRTPAFWTFALSSSVYGLVASGIALFNESILAERGLAPETYHRSLAVIALLALVGNFAGGAAAARGSLRSLLVAAMSLLTVSLLALPHVSTEPQVMGYACVMGLAGGFVMVLFFSFWGAAYGRAHLGDIQGAAQILTVFASAVGPLLLARCVAATGSYASAFYALAAVVAGLALAAAFVPIPHRVAAAD